MKNLNIDNFPKLIINLLILFVLTTQISYAAAINLEWDANSEEDLAGYKIYYGTSSGNYGTPISVGKISASELSGLTEGTTYYVAITAIDTSDNESEKSDEVNGVAQSPPSTTTSVATTTTTALATTTTTTASDTQAPTINITAPTASSTYSTSNSTINIGGTSSDNVGVTQITWSNNRGGSGSTSGTTSWSASNITLQEGYNIITLTARDAANNTATDNLTVTYSPDMTVIEYSSTDPVLVLTGSVPEEGSMTINIPDNLSKAISSTLLLTLYDPDLSGEGYIYINGNAAIDLPVGNYDNLEHSFEISVDLNQITTGANILRFTHVSTWGYEVRALAIRITSTSYEDEIDPTIAINQPTSESVYTTSNSTINICGISSDNMGVTQISWSNNRGGSGTASGTNNWSVSNISLQSGQNIITVTGRDAAGNTSTDTITITYTLPTTSTTSIIPPPTTTSVVPTTTTTPATTTTTLPSTTTSVSPTTTTTALTTTTTTPPTTSTSVTPVTTTTPATTSIPEITTTTTPVTTTSVIPVTTTVPATTTIPADTTPPTGTIIINNGDKVTPSQDVTLTLSAYDDGKELVGAALMTFSNDDLEWSEPEPYTTTKMWTLSSGKEDKTIYAKFRDVAGNWMIEPAKDQIRFEAPEDNCDTPHKLQPVSIEASSEFLPFCRKTNVADGNHRSLWSTALTLLWQNEFITLDFGEIKQISRIDMYASKLFNSDLFPLSFKIQISNDNLNWEEMYTENNYKLQSVRSASWDIDSYQTRYIRIYITKAKPFLFFFYLAQIAEIEVYGCDILEQNLASGNEDKKSEDNHKDETGDVLESDQGLPGVPGKPVITFY